MALRLVKVDFEKASVEALVSTYRRGALGQYAAIMRADADTANASYEQVAAAYRELRRRGRDAQLKLLPLLSESEPGVRMWAGAHALEFAPEAAARVLEALVEERGLAGFNAKMTLEAWRAGTLRFP